MVHLLPLLYLTTIRPPGRKDLNKLIEKRLVYYVRIYGVFRLWVRDGGVRLVLVVYSVFSLRTECILLDRFSAANCTDHYASDSGRSASPTITLALNVNLTLIVKLTTTHAMIYRY